MNPIYYITNDFAGGPKWTNEQRWQFIVNISRRWSSVIFSFEDSFDAFDIFEREIWCKENCSDYMNREGGPTQDQVIFYFREPSDAMAFKLRWL